MIAPVQRIGVWSTAFDGMPAAAARSAAAEIEGLGYSSIWFGEAYGREAFMQASLLLSGSSTITVGTGIASIHARDAMAAAAASRTLEELYPGRFVLGLGVSHAPLVEKMRGGTYSKPLEQMQTYLEALAAAPYFAAPAAMPQRVLAALGPKMLALSASHADGAHPYLVTPAHTAEARAAIGPDKMLVVEQAVVLTNDRDVFLERAHGHLNVYTGLPNYRNSWFRLGFSEDDAVRGGSVKLKEALVAWGSPEAIAARCQEHLDAGADQVVVQVLMSNPLESPSADWTALAPVLTAL